MCSTDKGPPKRCSAAPLNHSPRTCPWSLATKTQRCQSPNPLCSAAAAAAAEQRGLGDWQRCVFVANDHGQVLGEWLRGAAEQRFGGPLSVLHIDAHNDLNVPEASSVELKGDWLSNSSHREAVADVADLANFQQIATWAGLVDRVFWIRPGWGSPEDSVLKLGQDRSGSFSEELLNGPFNTLEHQSATARKAADAPLLRVHDIPDQSLAVPVEKKALLDRVRAEPYILDIDLDFFVEDEAAPERPPWLASGSDCPAACRRWPELACPLWEEMEAKVSSASGFLSSGCASSAVSVYRRLSLEQQERLSVLHLPEQLILANQLSTGTRPVRVEQQQMARQASRLRAFLAGLKDHPPVLVTVARSMDAFTGIFDVPTLERTVLELVQEVWGGHEDEDEDGHAPCVSYAEGTSELENMPAEHDFYP
mmetsp:Transcript_83503/g.183547  ORF Transcript_83503/g.183547 Transcript_83503/m.183547 type:complete len:423 (+) Transcript_83503:1273-2541(+)